MRVDPGATTRADGTVDALRRKGFGRVSAGQDARQGGKIGEVFGRPGRQVLTHLPLGSGPDRSSSTLREKAGPPAMADRTDARRERNPSLSVVTLAGD